MFKKTTDKRPWGKWELYADNEKCTVKLLHIKKGEQLSYQYHRLRSEFWHVVSGKALVTLNGKKIRLSVGGEVSIPIKAKHRAYGLTDTVILEVTRGKWDEDDIVRLEDAYNRK